MAHCTSHMQQYSIVFTLLYPLKSHALRTLENFSFPISNELHPELESCSLLPIPFRRNRNSYFEIPIPNRNHYLDNCDTPIKSLLNLYYDLFLISSSFRCKKKDEESPTINTNHFQKIFICEKEYCCLNPFNFCRLTICF